MVSFNVQVTYICNKQHKTCRSWLLGCTYSTTTCVYHVLSFCNSSTTRMWQFLRLDMVWSPHRFPLYSGLTCSNASYPGCQGVFPVASLSWSLTLTLLGSAARIPLSPYFISCIYFCVTFLCLLLLPWCLTYIFAESISVSLYSRASLFPFIIQVFASQS